MGTIPTLNTISAGAVGTAAMFNAIKTVVDFWANPPRCKANQATLQTLTTAVYAVVTLDAEDYDIVQSPDTAAHDNVTLNSRVFIRTSGKYLVSGQTGFVANGAGVRKVTIRKNAAGAIGSGTQLTSGAAPGDAGVQTSAGVTPVLVALTAGDYVEMFAYQSSGGNLNTVVSAGETFLTVELRSI